MAGDAAGSAERSRTSPRLVGWILHTLAVKAGKVCSGSPKRSSDSGCTWNWMLARSRDGSERVNNPSWDGAMVNGPRRRNAYSNPIPMRPKTEWYVVFSVFTPDTLKIARSEIRTGLDAGLHCGIAKRFKQFPAPALPLDPQFTADRMDGAGAEEMILVLLEIGQHVVPAPAGQSKLAPMIIVGRLAPHVDHAVDG